MQKDINYILFSILRCAIQGNQMSDSDKLLVTDESFLKVKELASKHDIAHLVGLGLINNKLVDAKKNHEVYKFTYSAVYRYEKINAEFLKICQALEDAKIRFIPLKGSVLKSYYPEPWMRTSCDIDILINNEDLDRATQYLCDNLKYSLNGTGSHDVALSSKNGVHLELHFTLVEEGRTNQSALEILNNVWDYVKVKENFSYFYEMYDEMFYFYHIAHMAKHFDVGGCGIRPFIDLWILDKIDGVDVDKRNNLLSDGGLLVFANVARELSKVWFENKTHNPVTEKTEKFIISGGAHGSLENTAKVQQLKKGGKCRYIMSMIFLSSKKIQKMYPIAQKYKWTIPIMQIRRWIEVVIRGISPRTRVMLRRSWNLSNSQAEDIKVFLDEIGL